MIHFQERFQIDAFSMKKLIVLLWTESHPDVRLLKLRLISVDGAQVNISEASFLDYLWSLTSVSCEGVEENV